MALWRKTMAVLMGAVLFAALGGCTPASNTPFDEEKEPHVVQGENREAAYNYAGAIESYHRALEVNPHSSIAHYRLGLLCEREDRDPAAAIYHFQQYLKLRPNSENAAVIRQHILSCKQELAKEVSLGLVSGEMKNQLDELVQKNQRLAADNQRLQEENRQLREQLTHVQAGPGSPTLEPPQTTRSSSQPTRTASAPPHAAGTTHTVQKGDTYYSIARHYGVTPSALEAANPGVNPNRLSIGQRLIVPAR